MQEQLIRQVRGIGNGAHVLAPKEWIGDRVFVVRAPRKSVKERILEVLEDYLEYVEGIYLYGSHARGEAREDSDVDLFVVTNRKLKISVNGFEIICLERERVKDAVKIVPVLIGSILLEAKTIVNQGLLDEFRRKIKFSEKDFRDYLEETRRMIDVNKEILDLDGEGKIKGGEIAYSLVLRLRSLYLIRAILKGKKYSSDKFKSWVGDDEIFEAYEKYKRKGVSVRLDKDKLVKTLLFLRGEIERL